MSEFLRKLKERVDEELAPVRRLEGDEVPTVRTALRIYQIAEEVAEELEEAVVGTARAAEITGWSVDTLQTYAKVIVEEPFPAESIPEAWRDMIVSRGPDGYLFRLATIPEKLARTG